MCLYMCIHTDVYFQHNVFRDIYTSKADIILFMLFSSSFTTSFRSCQCQLNYVAEPVSKKNSDVQGGVEN